MDKGALGARNQRAQQRILAAAGILAERFGLGEHQLTVQQRDRAVKAMMERELVAGLLEALVAATEPKETAPEPDPEPAEAEIIAATTRRNRRKSE